MQFRQWLKNKICTLLTLEWVKHTNTKSCKISMEICSYDSSMRLYNKMTCSDSTNSNSCQTNRIHVNTYKYNNHINSGWTSIRTLLMVLSCEQQLRSVLQMHLATASIHQTHGLVKIKYIHINLKIMHDFLVVRILLATTMTFKKTNQMHTYIYESFDK